MSTTLKNLCVYTDVRACVYVCVCVCVCVYACVYAHVPC